MAWRAVGSIVKLHDQVRPLAPNAPATSFGTKGDERHAESASDHNPHLVPLLGSIPVVTAGDFPLSGRLDPRAVLEAIRLSRDPRVKYGISRGQMFSSYPTSGASAWTWRPYSGSDGHFDHGHLSVIDAPIADDHRPWVISAVKDDDMEWSDKIPIFKMDANGVAQPNGTLDAAHVLGYANIAAWAALEQARIAVTAAKNAEAAAKARIVDPVAIDYDALARAINDDQARRMRE